MTMKSPEKLTEIEHLPTNNQTSMVLETTPTSIDVPVLESNKVLETF